MIIIGSTPDEVSYYNECKCCKEVRFKEKTITVYE